MHLIDTIAFPWKIWHALALSNLRINSVPGPRLACFQKVFVVLMTLHCLWTIFRVVTSSRLTYLSFAESLITIVQRFFHLWYPTIGSAIFFGTFATSDQQKEFLQDIMTIDDQFERSLAINLKYPDQKRAHTRRLIRWMSVDLVALSVFPLFGVVVGFGWNSLFQTTPQVFLCLVISLRVHQYTTFVDMINWRYGLVNAYIKEFDAIDMDRWPFRLAWPSKAAEIEAHCRQIKKLRQICMALNAASQRVNCSQFHCRCAFFMISLAFTYLCMVEFGAFGQNSLHGYAWLYRQKSLIVQIISFQWRPYVTRLPSRCTPFRSLLFC